MAGPEFKKGYNKGFEDGANSVEEGFQGGLVLLRT